MGNLAHTNTNVPTNLYWAKIWWILLDEQSQWAWISFTCSTELKSSSPFKYILQVSVSHTRNVCKSKNTLKPILVVFWPCSMIIFLTCKPPGTKKDHCRPLSKLIGLPPSQGLCIWLFCDLQTHLLFCDLQTHFI